MSIYTLSIYDLIEEFRRDPTPIGRFVGISNQTEKAWRFAIHLGDEKLVIFFDNGIVKENFDQLLGAKTLDQEAFKSLKFKEILQLEQLVEKNQHLEFYIYRMNLFETSKEFKLNTIEFAKVIKFNLENIHNLDEGDAISFERGPYSHHALLTDKSRMIVTHRWGEPENATELAISSNSILGIPTEKATVSEDHLLEVAGYRKLHKSNHSYDSLQLPKPKEEILAEAKRRVGEKGYSVLTQNCQHFVSEVRNGTCCSPEVEAVKYGALLTAATGLVTIGSLVVYSFLNSKSNNNKDKNSKSAVRSLN